MNVVYLPIIDQLILLSKESKQQQRAVDYVELSDSELIQLRFELVERGIGASFDDMKSEELVVVGFKIRRIECQENQTTRNA